MKSKELVLGIDLGGTNFRIGLVNKDGEIVNCKVESSSILITAEKTSMEVLVSYIKTYLAESLEGKPVATAIGFPSTVSKDKTMIYAAPNLNLTGFANVNISDYISSRINIPVFIEKDVNLLLICDLKKMNMKGIIIGMYIGTGFGNSIYINGEFLDGKNGVAGELGHIPTHNDNGLCGCGNTGCAEVYASGKALRKLRDSFFFNTNMGDIFTEHSKDERIMQYIDGVSIPIATEINILDPDSVIIGGGVPAMKGFPREYLEECIKKHARKPYPAESLVLTYSKNKQEAGVIGAGLYAFQRLTRKRN